MKLDFEMWSLERCVVGTYVNVDAGHGKNNGWR